MRMSELLGERYKEKPADCTVESHALMVRGGYIKQVNTGVYTLLPPGKRITTKIERIIREEMDRIGGQEVLFPVVLPADLWKESGRFTSVGKELVRLTDRWGADMVLGMTHEEAAVHLARDAAKSYAKYPFMIYQIQTKFRDEPRARGGLIRVREFTMKDAYSFHTSQADLEAYYARCYEAYERIFKRAGCKNVIAVLSDSGMMGGKVSHEFMLLTAIGEDTLVICDSCDFKANLEAAPSVVDNSAFGAEEPLTLVPTPEMATIEEVAGFLHKPHTSACKAVGYQKNADDSYVIAFVRGDLEVHETKLRNAIGAEIHPGVITPDSGIVAGFIGPMGLDTKKITVVFAPSLEGIGALVCGANKAAPHYTGVNIARDYGKVTYLDIAKATPGGICPVCGKKTLRVSNGIEVGNIFQLGTKYTKTMNMQYLDENGELQYPIMGCYGIGVGRLAASVCEESHDDYGPIWPISIAPWEAQICVLRADQEEPKRVGEELYAALTKAGVEAIIDDRPVSAGVVFSEADLIGAPIRLTVSPRNLADGMIELTTRDKSVKRQVPVAETLTAVLALKQELFDRIEGTL